MEKSNKNKRKFNDVEGNNDENEEEKIEMFYTLVKSIREARRSMIMMRNNGLEETNSTKEQYLENDKVNKQKQIHDQEELIWKPSFQLQDFTEEVRLHQINPVPNLSLASAAGSSQKSIYMVDDAKQKKAKQDLDLRLSL